MQLFDLNAIEPLQQAGSTVFSNTYHGWQVEISECESTFLFQCYPPDLEDFIDSGEEYADQATAMQAAFDFVDREIAIRALLEVANEWLWSGLISEDEYWNLTNFA